MNPQFPTVQEQINYWNEIERLELERVSRIQEAESRDATNETRAVNRTTHGETREQYDARLRREGFPESLTSQFKSKQDDLLSVCKHHRPIVIGTHPDGSHCYHADICHLVIRPLSAASNPQEQVSTTAKTLTQEEIEEREEATNDWYDEREREWSLREAGSNDGEGESYASRNA